VYSKVYQRVSHLVHTMGDETVVSLVLLTVDKPVDSKVLHRVVLMVSQKVALMEEQTVLLLVHN